MIQNKEYLIYSLENAVNYLKEEVNKSIQTNIPEHKEVYYRLGTSILWIGICIGNLKELNITYTKEENDYVQAFLGAYNAQKHGVDFLGFTGFISGNRWPIRFPMRFGDGNYFFKELDENIIQNKEQIKRYNKILKERDIITCVNKIKDIIIEKIKNED